MYDVIIQPQFAQIADDYTGVYKGTLSEFTLADNVSLVKGSPIIDLFGSQNILQRKDASCKTNWKQIAKGSTRRITTEELYGAVENCQQAFYQGCLKDFREQNDVFKDYIMKFFTRAIGMDIISNSYFGDVARTGTDGDKYSINVFDGIFTKYAQYISGTNNAYAPQVLTALPSGVITPAQAWGIFQAAFDAQTDEMEFQLDTDLAFYVDKDLAKALMRYYIGIGWNTTASGDSVSFMMNGIPSLQFQGIPVFVEPTWKPILRQLNGGTNNAHALILTIRQNFMYGTHKGYGGGPELDQPSQVWYSMDEDVWKQKMYLTGGTELITPQNTVIGLTNIA